MKVHSKKTIVIADKLQDMGGGETVLAQICEALNPEFVFTSTVNTKHDWKKILGVNKIVTPFWGIFVRNRFIWFLFYPLICFLMSRVRVSSDESIMVYSSTISKFAKIFSKKRVILYSNYPARGIFFPQEFFKSTVILFLVRPFVAIFKLFEQRCIKKYSNIYVISEACRDAYKNMMGIESTVLNCPTDNVFYDYYDKSKNTLYSERLLIGNKPTFVLVSRLVDWKNLEYVFKYFDEQNNFNLNVVGGGPLLENYRTNYNKNCKFLGYLSVEDKIKVMDASCGLVFPSVQEWSLVTIEANSLGLPVLGVECGATKETQIVYSDDSIPATCFTYETPDSQSLSRAIGEFMEIKWDSSAIHEHSNKFSPIVFRKKIKNIMSN